MIKSGQSKAAVNLLSMVYCKAYGLVPWTQGAEDLLQLMAQNIIAGNYW